MEAAKVEPVSGQIDVPYGMGAKSGMSVSEHVWHALSVQNPLLRDQQVSHDLAKAVSFECTHCAEDINGFRAQ
eukprot:6492642-Amphidinium_carterae.2